ncbi:MAG: glycosyltransferase family 39 protein [Betaproteobacteria bacterium]
MQGHDRLQAANADNATTVKGEQPPSWRELALVAGLIFVWLCASAWLRPLALPDEGRYVGVAWEMMRSGDWLTPTLNGMPFFHKPPLFYWITATSLSLLGLTEGAARAAPILGAWLGAFALYLFARNWWSERIARMSLVALLAQPLLYIGGQYANLDMLVAGCISATILLLAHVVLSIEHGRAFRRALLGAYAMAALAVLAKGLIGAVIPALVILAWLVLLRRWRIMLALFSLPGLLLFVLLAGPWFVAMQSRFDEFLYYFIVVQHFKRFAGSGFNGVWPFWFYPAVLLLAGLPGLPWLYRQLRLQSEVRRAATRLLMWVWVVVVVLFFSIPQSKLLGYVLPAVPPLAFLMADGFTSLRAASSRLTQLWWGSAAVSACLSLGAVVWFTVHPPESSRALAATLLAQRAPNEPLIMLNDYLYDVPFYARMTPPIPVVNEWTSPEMLTRDDGHKELIDAGQFDRARAATTLISPQSLPTLLCSTPVTWIMGRTGWGARYAFLTRLQAIATHRETSLWRVDAAAPVMAQALNCPVPPGSAAKGG